MVELLLSIAAIAVIAAFTAPVFVGVQARHEVDIAGEAVAGAFRRAQTHARGMDGDSDWGVRIATSSVTLFRGSSFASRAVTEDEIFVMPDIVSPSGLLEATFEKFTGLPETTGTTTLVTPAGDRRDIAVNAYGTVSY